MDSDTAVTGLVLLRASRLESLLGPLQVLLEETRPGNPLEPQTVVAAHPGMKQWLTGALAGKVGVRRIVANLEVLLPGAWLDALSRQQLGDRAVGLPQYRRGNLRWTLHAMLGELGRYGIADQRVLTYLASAGSADERALRRFQLADRLARVFSRYLVYRCEWLDAWEAGKYGFATAGTEDAALRMLERQFLAPLWNAVALRLGEHRGKLVKALAAVLESPGATLPPLHVFGLSHLPPAELSVVRAYARSAPVFVYVPDPCREYWGGLYRGRGDGRWRLPDIDAWQAFGKDERARLEAPDALDWREQGHPLLARWGRLGQHFFAALADDNVREDIRHWQDEATASPGDRLQRLQESIRRLEPGLMAEDARAPAAIADASLRIHACHTRQRELEVLRDALLDAIEHAGVRPGDIVVMAPDIQAYLPLIPAVFGEPGSARERLLPYHLADVPVARSHPLFAVFETLLGIGASRITAPEVVDLLAVPEVRRALALDDDGADTLVEWLANSRVAWALDGAHKGALSLPSRAEFSFAWAMDRMLAGYLMADVPGAADPEAVGFSDGTELLPIPGIEGPNAAALGSLDRLLRELQGWRDVAQVEQKASRWAVDLRERVDALIRIDPADADARAALSVVHRAIANLEIEPACNGADPVLRLNVVRELLQDALAAAPERQRFLMGGITFCGMVPQRAIPFDVVCVLGLDEGAFPRNPSDGGIDLMARIRRAGDRDVPADDRYLFLETVMSARKRLHLSYIGQGVRDGKSRNPAAPLAELMAELELHAGIAPDDAHDKTQRPWRVQHPLQPFDACYFDGTRAELYSYSHAFAGMRGEGRSPSLRLHDGKLPTAEPLPEPLPLGLLEGFFKDPARALLKEHLQLSLDALDDDARLPEDEPMDGIAQMHAVARRVFLQHLLPRKCADSAWVWDRSPPAWVKQGGLLPLGAAAESAWTNEAAAVEALWQQADASARFDERGASGGRAERVDVALIHPADAAVGNDAPRRITGIVRNVFPLRGFEHGLQVVFAYPKPSEAKTRLKKPDALNFKDRVPPFLHWALLRLHCAGSDVPAPVRLTMLADGEPDLAAQVNEWDEKYCEADSATRAEREADLRRRLRALVELWRKGREGLSRFYPKVGWEAAKDKPEDAIASAVRDVWVRDFGEFAGERDYAPGHARLLEGDLVFGDPETDVDSRALHALVQDARLVNELIMLDAAAADADANAQEESA